HAHNTPTGYNIPLIADMHISEPEDGSKSIQIQASEAGKRQKLEPEAY
ncbi:hypothetical protein A2U01_0087834, partial [Trifolium medium]|nr:hypothetical protein [Trifolium medium]